MSKQDPFYNMAANLIEIKKDLATATINTYASEVDELIRLKIKDTN